MKHPAPLAGYLLFLSVLASLGHGYFSWPVLPVGLLQLAAALLLLRQVSARVRSQSIVLALVGLIGLFLAGEGVEALLAALSRNQSMIAMLASVGILRIVPLPEGSGAPPEGRRALRRTLFGVHWLGSVTNVSAMVLFGDRMGGDSRRLDPVQSLALGRGFALAAFWSPFFVAMGVALTAAPGARLTPLVLWGLPLSQILLLMMSFTLRKHPAGEAPFVGYPFTPVTLAGPTLLALSVLLLHELIPSLSVVTLVSFAAPVYALFACRRRRPLASLRDYIRWDLTRMGPELLLFLAAGVLGSGFTALVGSRGLPLPEMGGLAAAILGMAVIVAVAAAGVHPVVGITAVGAVLAPLGIRPELLAMSFLFGWGLGVIISPISGTHLLLSGRYGFALGRVWRWNAHFVSGALLLCSFWLFLFDRLG